MPKLSNEDLAALVARLRAWIEGGLGLSAPQPAFLTSDVRQVLDALEAAAAREARLHDLLEDAVAMGYHGDDCSQCEDTETPEPCNCWRAEACAALEEPRP